MWHEKLGQLWYLSVWHHVHGTQWWLSCCFVRAGALDLAAAVRQRMGSGSWLQSNCCSCPSSCLPNSFCFPCMLDGPHRREQEEKPSELGIQCEMEMLWDCLLPGKNSSTFSLLSLPIFRIPRKRSMTLLCMYSFLSARFLSFSLWWCVKSRWTLPYLIKV